MSNGGNLPPNTQNGSGNGVKMALRHRVETPSSARAALQMRLDLGGLSH